MEEVPHSLQQSWSAFQNDIKNRLFKQQAQQDKITGTLNELITRLSQQVLQMSTQFNDEGNKNSPCNPYLNFSRIFRVDFPKLKWHDE